MPILNPDEHADGGTSSSRQHPNRLRVQMLLQHFPSDTDTRPSTTTPSQSQPLHPTLSFTADFETGNIGKVVPVSEVEYDIWVRPDTANDRHRVWFHFAIQPTHSSLPTAASTTPTAPHRVILNLINFSKVKSLYRAGFTPVVRSLRRPEWRRIPSKNTFYYICPRHKKKYVLSITFAFDHLDDVYYFAYSVPYLYSQLQSYLTDLEIANFDYLNRKSLGESIEGRRHWQNPIPTSQPTILATKNFLTSHTHPPDIYIDIHAHSTLTHTFIYGNDFSITHSPSVHAVQYSLPSLLAQKVEGFSIERTSFDRDEGKRGTGRRTVGEHLTPSSKCYTLEVSFFCYQDPVTGENVPYTVEKYMELGKNLVSALVDFYGFDTGCDVMAGSGNRSE
ncbi:Cytosolic carboxypeptidase 6 [Rhizophlyctis rosea]|nr:Cytosolic carboxypeptidase 6 [Rhizophlyctis rosea]